MVKWDWNRLHLVWKSFELIHQFKALIFIILWNDFIRSHSSFIVSSIKHLIVISEVSYSLTLSLLPTLNSCIQSFSACAICLLNGQDGRKRSHFVYRRSILRPFLSPFQFQWFMIWTEWCLWSEITQNVSNKLP